MRLSGSPTRTSSDERLEMTEYDQGYKLLFSHPKMVMELLTGFVREDWIAQLDFDSLEKVNASYVSEDLRERHDDVIWKVRFADEWLYLYILLEFQSSVDSFMSVRTLAYVGLLYQDLIRTKQLTSNGKLPPVLPIVLYNGDRRWTAETEVFDLIENIPGSLAKYSPRLKYLLIDEGACEHAELESVKNLVSVLFQLEKAPSREIGRKLMIRFIKWVKDNKELQRAFFVFINRIYFKGRVDVDKLYEDAKDANEVAAMLEKNVDRWIEEWKAEGRAEGEAKGEARERARGEAKLREAAKRMLAAGMSASQVSELLELSEEEVQKLRDSVAH